MAENVKVYSTNVRTPPASANEVTAPAYIDRHDTHENISNRLPGLLYLDAKNALNLAKIANGPVSLAIMCAIRQVTSPPIAIIIRFIPN